MGKIDEKAGDKVHPSQITDFNDLPEDVKNVDIASSIEEYLDRDVVILGFTEMKSEFKSGYYLLIEANVGGKVVEIATGAKHILAQLDGMHEHLPIRARFQKRGRSYYIGDK